MVRLSWGFRRGGPGMRETGQQGVDIGPTPYETRAMQPPARVLVGRTREIAELSASVRAAEEGHGGLCLLAGEPGIGKTRLADEVSRIAAERGFQAKWGRCWEVGGAPAYWPWIQILRGLLRIDDLPVDEVTREF